MKSIFLIIFAALFLSASEAEQIPLTITITNVQSTKGNMRIGIYKANNDFSNEDDTYKSKVYKVNKEGSILIKIKDLPYGEYAIGFHHDENKNAKLDKNFIGIPKEPFCFSNNIKPRFSAPSFDECKFKYSANNANMSVELLVY